MRKFSHLCAAVFAAAAVLLMGTAPAAAQTADTLFAEAMADAAMANDDWDAPKRALEKFGKACDAGLTKACYNAAIMANANYDDSNVQGWLGKGCKNDDLDACYLLANYTKSGVGGPTNDVAAREQYGNLCAAKLPWACMNFAEMLSEGNGGAEDKPAAFKTYGTACDLGAGGGCFQAGVMLQYGGLGESDDKASDEDDNMVAVDTSETAPPDPGFLLFEKGCKLGNGSSCYEVAAALQSGTNVAKDPEQAAKLFRKLCLEGDTAACGRMMEGLRP